MVVVVVGTENDDIDHSIGRTVLDAIYNHPELETTELRIVARQLGHAVGSMIGTSIAGAMVDKERFIDENYIEMIRNLMIDSFNFALNHSVNSGFKDDSRST